MSRGEWAKWYEIPKPGMIVFFDFIDSESNFQRDGFADHVGIVASVTNDSKICVEGNYNNKCDLTKYELNCSNIVGYGAPKFK